MFDGAVRSRRSRVACGDERGRLNTFRQACGGAALFDGRLPAASRPAALTLRDWSAPDGRPAGGGGGGERWAAPDGSWGVRLGRLPGPSTRTPLSQPGEIDPVPRAAWLAARAARAWRGGGGGSRRPPPARSAAGNCAGFFPNARCTSTRQRACAHRARVHPAALQDEQDRRGEGDVMSRERERGRRG